VQQPLLKSQSHPPIAASFCQRLKRGRAFIEKSPDRRRNVPRGKPAAPGRLDFRAIERHESGALAVQSYGRGASVAKARRYKGCAAFLSK